MPPLIFFKSCMLCIYQNKLKVPIASLIKHKWHMTMSRIKLFLPILFELFLFKGNKIFRAYSIFINAIKLPNLKAIIMVLIFFPVAIINKIKPIIMSVEKVNIIQIIN